MKYFDTFTGYGGFSLGIQRAFSRKEVYLIEAIHPVSSRVIKSWSLASLGWDRFPDNFLKSINEELPDLQIKIYERIQNDTEAGGRGQTEGVSLGRVWNPSSEPDIGQSPTCIGYSEVNKYAIQVYEKHFQHKPYGDITKINPTELPDFDLLTGGFPCQAFSIAGKRQGFNDTRGTLFFDIARILKEKRPRNFILENVKGLLSHDNGRTFKIIITTLIELGYCVEWQVLNAKDFGVPQNRERVFIVGHFGGVPERKVFPLGHADGVFETPDSGQRQDVANSLKAKQGGPDADITLIAHTVRTSDRSSGIEKKQNWDSYEVDGRIRRLTPTECERLMGLPDGWTAEGTAGKISDTQRYKLCGNGVVVNVVEAVVRKLYGL